MSDFPDFTPEEADRHRCSYQCGRPFQFGVFNVDDSSTEFLCLPCFMGLATSIIQAAVQTGLVSPDGNTVPVESIAGYNAEPDYNAAPIEQSQYDAMVDDVFESVGQYEVSETEA